MAFNAGKNGQHTQRGFECKCGRSFGSSMAKEQQQRAKANSSSAQYDSRLSPAKAISRRQKDDSYTTRQHIMVTPWLMKNSGSSATV